MGLLRRRTIGQDLLDVPFPEMIKSMGLAVAEAQFELDRVGIRLAQMMSGKYETEEPDPEDPDAVITVERESYVTFNGEQLSMLELGFTPTFYQFVDTIIEVKVSLSMSRSRELAYDKSSKTKSIGVAALPFAPVAGARMRSTAVNASFAAKYQYSAEGSSLMRTKLVPVPPPAVLEERIRRVIDQKYADE
ncbi:MAG: hypothetical protein ACPG4N_00030 [Gammaproteobacteria bacterium]